MNIRFGIQKAFYGLMLLSAVFGGFVALRQISLHICPTFVKFGIPFWGLSLYTWSFIIFAASVAFIALLLLIFNKTERGMEPLNWWGGLAFIFIFLLVIANVITTLWQCGLGPCPDVH